MISTLGVGSLITVNAFDTVGIHTNATISGNWETTNLSTSDGNHYTGNIYFKGKASGNYEMGMKVAGNWKVFGGYWIKSGDVYNTAWNSGGNNNDQIVPTTTTTTTYIKGAVDFYKEYSGNPRLVITQTTLNLSTTVTVGSSTLTSGETTTIGKTNSGGSGSYSNTYKVRRGSSSGTDVTSSVLSGTTFTAPEVTTATTYYVTTTVTDNNTSATKTSSAKTITVNPQTYDITFSQPTNGSIKVNNSTSSPVSIVKGNSVSLVITPSSGYKIKTLTDNGSAVSAAVGKTTAYTYTISNVTAAHTIAATMEAANTPLAAPSIKLNNSASNLTTTASKGNKVTLSWASVANAGSYEIYKNGSLVTTITSTSYSIERGYSYSGAYTVVAVPTNTTSYSSSPASNSLTLTVNKVKLAAPTVSPSATQIVKGGTVTFSITNTNSSYTAGTDYKYQHTGAGNSTYADVTELSWTSGALNSTGNQTFKFKATAVLTDYFSNSDETSVTVEVCAASAYHLTGDMVTGQGGAAGWPTAITTYPVNTFVSKNIFYRSVTVSGGGANDKHYFRLTDQSNQYTVTEGTDTDMSTHDSSSSAVTASKKTTNGAMYVTGNGTFKIYVDQTTSGSPKVWVVSNEWSIGTNAYYQTFNLATDSHNNPVAGTSGGTVSGNVEVIKGQSTTLTATAASGYTFDGWYTSTDFTTATRKSTDASYTFTPDASGDYYALFKENTPAHYTLSVANVDNATVKATYNGTTLQEGSGSKSVPVGATVTVSITLSTGYKLDSTTPSGLTSGTSTFTMPASNTAVSATVSKIQYALTAAVSPNYGTLKFYSNSNCTAEITTATYQQTFYAKYTPPSAYYARNNITCTSGSATRSAISGNKATFTMGAGAATITATVKAATPTFGTCSGMTVYANESFTYTGASLATLPNSTLSYTFQGTTNSTGVFTAPTTAGTYTLTITASNKPTGISTAATATTTVSIVVKYHESTVTYYVDMHDNPTSGKTLKLAVVASNSTSAAIKKDSDGNNCEATLTQQQSSSVYAATVTTPVTKNGTDNYLAAYIKITYGSSSYVTEISAAQVKNNIVGSASPEVWLEAVNEASQKLTVTNATRSTAVPASGYRRIYLAKPYSWNSTTEADWENIGIYHWGDYTDIGWDNGVVMKYLGYDSTGSSGYKYYYADIKKEANNIIFQGWGSNTSAGSYSKAQTGNIENISSSANYFVLSKDGSAYNGTKGDDVVIPNYTKYVSSVKMNLTESTAVSVAPTYTGKSVSYGTGNSNIVTVNSSGKLTPVASGTTTISVTVNGTIGAKITGGRSNGGDRITYSVNVTISDPTKFHGFNIMSFYSKEYTVNAVPDTGSTTPAYFDMSQIETDVTGIQGVVEATNSAIITPVPSSAVTVSGATKYSAIKVKYAYSNPTDLITGYDGISITASVVTKSIKASGSARYGLDHWTLTGTGGSSTPTYTTTKSITDGVETVKTEGIAFVDTYHTYSAVYTEYTYVDVTFVYDYYEYKPEVDEDGMVNYPYDADYAGTEDRSSASFNQNTHTHKTYTASSYEVRGQTAASITPSSLVASAGEAIGAIPQNNYYTYTINASTIPSGEIVRNTSAYTATVYVHMTHAVRHYTVTLKEGSKTATTIGNNYTYQQYVEPSVSASSKWYALDKNGEKGPLLATGKSYKFRVKGNTNLATEAGSITDANFNRSEVGFSHYEVTHQNNSQSQNVEYLLQNFYIADFFDKAKVINTDNDNLPYDDAEFVGGGVVYYSMKNNEPFSGAVDAGYVNSDGTISEADVKYLLKTQIESKLANNSDETLLSVLEETLSTDDAMKIVYGQEIPVTKNVENGINTGIIYRYLPLKNYTLNNNAPVLDDDKNYAFTLNNNTFRYSNSLQSYQYIYASGNENKVTNSGKDMRLYSYYVYSYLDYDEDNVPVTKYEVVLSDQYSDASTYWDGTN